MKKWEKTFNKIQEKAEDIRYKPSKDIVKILKYRIIDTGAGNGGCFNSWVFSCGDVRHVGAYCYYIIWFTNDRKDFTLNQLKDMARNWIKQPAEFSGYCGFVELWGFVQEVFSVLEDIETKEDFVKLINALWEYSNNLNAWIYHYIPWGAFYVTPTMNVSYYKDAVKQLL